MKAPWLAAMVTAVALLLAASSGCALTTKQEPVIVRWFTPERVKPRLTSAEMATGSGAHLMLGEVGSGASVRDRIAYRTSAHEIGYYEDLRWSERPATYVRRELGRALFEERGFERAVGGDAPVLDVEVQAFEEVKLPDGARAARVQLHVRLAEGHEVILEETLAVDRAVSGSTPTVEAFVAAMSEALDDAVQQVTARVARVLLDTERRPRP